MRLTGWYRIGIVLSVLWCFTTILFVVYQYNTGRYGYHSILISYVVEPSQSKPSIDHETPPWGPDPSQPTLYDQHGKEVIFDPVDVYNPVVNYTMVLLLLIVPVVSGWILVFTIKWTIKWVIRGFKSHS